MPDDFVVEVEAERAAGTFSFRAAAARLASQRRISLEEAERLALELYSAKPISEAAESEGRH